MSYYNLNAETAKLVTNRVDHSFVQVGKSFSSLSLYIDKPELDPITSLAAAQRREAY
jgi:hypothetical protein